MARRVPIALCLGGLSPAVVTEMLPHERGFIALGGSLSHVADSRAWGNLALMLAHGANASDLQVWLREASAGGGHCRDPGE